MKRGDFPNFHLSWLAAMLLFSALPSSVFARQAGAVDKKASGEASPEGKTPDSARSSPATSINETSPGLNSTLSDFAWLEGKWQGAWGPRIAEQVWTAPKAGQMLGLFRVVENDKTLVIELFSLFETPDGIELQLRHFTPALVPWEQSDFTTMKLVDLVAKTAAFENVADGQPKRDVFTRADPDTYISKSEIALAAGGSHITEITYHRQK
jgi:hypothetical protein